MQDILVCTPSPSPVSSPNLDSDIMQAAPIRTPLSLLARKSRYVSMDGIPSIEFHSKFDELCKSLTATCVINANIPYLTRLAPLVAHQLLEHHDDSRTIVSSLEDPSLGRIGEICSQKLENLPFPLSQPDFCSSIGACIWMIEIVVICCANGCLRSYQDKSMQWLVEEVSTWNLLDELLAAVREHDIYTIVEKILELQTSTTAQFGSQALISSVANEDERLFELLLRSKVHLDGFRESDELKYHNVCALHVAVHHQNLKYINRLLEQGIDPDGYIDQEDNWNLKPMTYLLELYSIRDIISVRRIFPTVLSRILLAQVDAYTLERFARNVTSLFLGAWCRDAADFIKALSTHCQGLSAAELRSAPCLRVIASGSNDTKTVQNILQIRPRLDPSDPLYEMMLFKAVRIEHLPIISRILLEGNPRVWMVPSGLDIDTFTVQELLGAGMVLAGLSTLLLFLNDPVRTGNFFVCELVLNAFEYRPVVRSVPVYNQPPPNEAEKRFLSTVIESENRDVVLRVLERLAFEKFWPWPRFLGAAFRLGSLDDCQKLTRVYQNSASDTQQESTFWEIMRLIVAPKITEMQDRKPKLALLISIFDNLPWRDSVSPAKFSHYCQWNLLEVLIDAGLPFDKDLLLSFGPGNLDSNIMVENAEKDRVRVQALLRIFKQNPMVLTGLTENEELEVLKRCMATKDPDRRLLFECFANFRGCVREDRFANIILSNSTLCHFLGGTWSCQQCPSYEKCTQIICRAVGLGDVEVLQDLIANGFTINQRANCDSSIPLVRAFQRNRVDIVQCLLQAGADANARDYEGTHVLLEAVRFSSFQIIQTILEAGAVVCSRAIGYDSTTALEEAAEMGSLDIVCLLVSNSPVDRQLKYDCKRAAIRAKHEHHYNIARYLEHQAEKLEKTIGRNSLDDAIERLCECLLKRKDFKHRCSGCKTLYSTERSWWISLIYYTYALPVERSWEDSWPSGSRGLSGRHYKLKAELTGNETSKEIEELLESDYTDESESEESDSSELDAGEDGLEDSDDEQEIEDATYSSSMDWIQDGGTFE